MVNTQILNVVITDVFDGFLMILITNNNTFSLLKCNILQRFLNDNLGKIRKHENCLDLIYTCTFIFLKLLSKRLFYVISVLVKVRNTVRVTRRVP